MNREAPSAPRSGPIAGPVHGPQEVQMLERMLILLELKQRLRPSPTRRR